MSIVRLRTYAEAAATPNPRMISWVGGEAPFEVRTGSDITISDDLAQYAQGDTLPLVPGDYHITSPQTVGGSVVMSPGASLSISEGVTLTIAGRVESPRQRIFRGAGDVRFTAEDSRYAHVSWFGAYVSDTSTVDMGPILQRCADAMGNSREARIEADTGNYFLATPVVWNRGTRLLGNGSRLTIFKVAFADGDVFQTAGDACRFEGIQFELYTPWIAARTSGYLINLMHQYGRLEDVAFSGLGSYYNGFRLGAYECKARGIRSLRTGVATPGTHLIRLAGDATAVEDVVQLGASGPETVVLVGSESEQYVTAWSVENVEYNSPSYGVSVESGSGDVIGGTINNIKPRGAGPAAVRILNTGSKKADNIVISNVPAGSRYIDAGVLIQNDGVGTVSDIHLNGVVIDDIPYGVRLIRNAGAMNGIRIANCDLRKAATPIERVGGPLNVQVDVLSAPTVRQPAVCYDLNLPDDTVGTIVLDTPAFCGQLMVSTNAQDYGMFAFRAASGPWIVAASASANVASTNVQLYGTTGADGKLTVGVQDGVIYVENRLGAQKRVSVAVLTGIAA